MDIKKRALALAASSQSDFRKNFNVIQSATRHRGTKIKIHTIPLCLRSLVADLLFRMFHMNKFCLWHHPESIIDPILNKMAFNS